MAYYCRGSIRKPKFGLNDLVILNWEGQQIWTRIVVRHFDIDRNDYFYKVDAGSFSKTFFPQSAFDHCEEVDVH